MVQESRPFDGTNGDGGPYSAANWARTWRGMFSSNVRPDAGVFDSSGDGSNAALNVEETAPASTNVRVRIGEAAVLGYWYGSDAEETIAIPANNNGSGFDRIDLVVLRWNATSQEVRLALLEGTPAGSPAAPALTQTSTIWEIPLAEVTAPNLFTSIVDANIDNTVREYAVVRTANEGGTGFSGGYTEGDILVAQDSQTLARISPSQDGSRITADSGVTNGVKWIDARPIILSHRQTSGTDGDNLSAGVRLQLTLNELLPAGHPLCTLSSNQFTLEEGAYAIDFFVQLSQAGTNAVRTGVFLYDVDAAADEVYLSGTLTDNQRNFVIAHTYILTVPSGGNTYELQGLTSDNQAVAARNVGASITIPQERFSTVTIRPLY